MDSYHKSMSQIQDSIDKAGQPDKAWALELQVLLKKPLSFYLENRKEMFTTHNTQYGTVANQDDQDEVFSSNSYKSLYNLTTLNHLRPLARQHNMAFMTYFFLKCLDKVNYFGQQRPTSGELTRDQMYISRLLLHFLAVSALNSHELVMYEAPEAGPWSDGGISASNFVGSAISPTMDLMNHSCDPNTTKFNSGRGLVLIATRDIHEGDEVSHCYYSTYPEKPLDMRRKYYQERYYFHCQCHACEVKWPEANDIPKGFNDLRDGQLKIDHEKDGMALVQQIQKIQKLGSSISLEQRNGNYSQALAYCVEFAKIIDDTLERPHSYFVMVEMAIHKLLWILHGTKRKI